MASSPPPSQPDPRPTAQSQLVDQLRERILDGTLPTGTPLREESLAQTFTHSRHTVRSAISQLASERLVKFVPFRGARVAELTDTEVEDLQALRGALESEAIRKLHERHGSRWPKATLAPILEAIEKLAEAEADGDWFTINRAHAAVHNAIVREANSARISETYEQLTSETLLLLAGLSTHYPMGSLESEHRAFLEQIQCGDGSVVRDHLGHTTELIRKERITSAQAQR